MHNFKIFTENSNCDKIIHYVNNIKILYNLDLIGKKERNMKREYRNKLIATAALLIGILIFVTVDAYVSYEPDDNTPGTEQVSDTEE